MIISFNLCRTPTTQLFTTDTISYYSSIDTHQALREIDNYLTANEDKFEDMPV